ncbi:solute carrier family 30 (zinc transporter), member 1 [Cryptococcus wingfieldii CBS 7118]|uniref:Solute carrier family 30 (Zinc transporter), member 1 n=1 Tax=Cryptococcus wingfieldii CBS 7118 TaxID=1295528 RepID=A0A1E3K2V6_9TREE|nr:solute carrier family 30 (zinc transporter), member 1 [Cryptococcus wingfieldii CBS 7118]ODO07351.1 solute carrier family 30 (zinc transporter), member 1 [Cryptococcus wingfieldii CBS 7118]
MGLSRQARIKTLLAIDTLFFFIELITGYAVGSLALVADSFHMLNDVLSLVVALYTIKLATSPSSAANSYGWQRAEILGALINSVFLVALCVSIGLEAVGRIVTPPEISNAQLIVFVGSLGLLSNIVGLFLFHDHGHSHGGHSHGAIALPGGDVDANEETPLIRDDVSELYQHPAQTRAQVIETAQEFGYGSTQVASSFDSSAMGKSPLSAHGRAPSASRRSNRASISRPHGRMNSTTRPIPGQNADLLPVGAEVSSTGSSTVVDAGKPKDHSSASDHSHAGHSHAEGEHDHAHDHGKMAKNVDDAEAGHSHGHGHSHGSMNMRGVFLHVLGDALGNVGVIAAGLVIWFFEGRWTLYFDPGVSLVITCIIFSSALPLCKSASYILLQGVPSHVSLDAVRQSIVDVDGVDSVHELHIWQLSESTVVASVHVLIEHGKDYMEVASGIREKMHSHGIHSVTIQPEFYDEADTSAEACLIRCPPGDCEGDTCCPPASSSKPPSESGEVAHNHNHTH